MDIFHIISAMIKLAAYFVMVKVLILQNIRYCCAAGRAVISFTVILVLSFCIGLLILNVWVNFSPSQYGDYDPNFHKPGFLAQDELLPKTVSFHVFW